MAFVTWEPTSMTSIEDEAGDGVVSAGAAPSAWTYTVVDYLRMVVAMVGFLGNGLVLLVIKESSTLRKHMTGIYIASQTALDMAVSLFLLLQTAFPYKWGPMDSISGHLWCQLWRTNICFWSLYLASTYNLVALTLERYFEVVWPIRHKVLVTREKILISIAIIVVSSFVYSLIINLTTGRVEDGECRLLAYWTSNSAQIFFTVCNTSLRYVIPCLVFLVCYTHMAWFLHKHKFVVGTAPMNSSTRELNMERARNNVIKTLIYVGFAYLFFTSWNQILFILINAGILGPSVYSTPFFSFSIFLYYANSVVNPFIYAFKYKQFQRSAKALFAKACGIQPHQDSISSVPANSGPNLASPTPRSVYTHSAP